MGTLLPFILSKNRKLCCRIQLTSLGTTFLNTIHINNEEENPLLGASCMYCLSALQFEDTKAECLRGLVC